MHIEMKQETPSNAKCLNCGYFGQIEKFSPKVVPLNDSNNPNVKWEITSHGEGMELMHINLNCPVCNSTDIDTEFQSNLN